MKQVYEKLRIARTNLNLSQEYVANELNLTRTAVVQIEAGKRKISVEELKGFCNIYGLSADEILENDHDESPSIVFVRIFDELEDNDKKEIVNLMRFKKMMSNTKNNE